MFQFNKQQRGFRKSPSSAAVPLLWPATQHRRCSLSVGNLARGHFEESRRLLPFIPASNSLVESVMCRAKGRKEKREGREGRSEGVSHHVEPVLTLLRQKSKWVWLKCDTTANDATQILMMPSRLTRGEGMTCWSHCLFVSITGVSPRPVPGHAHTDLSCACAKAKMTGMTP